MGWAACRLWASTTTTTTTVIRMNEMGRWFNIHRLIFIGFAKSTKCSCSLMELIKWIWYKYIKFILVIRLFIIYIYIYLLYINLTITKLNVYNSKTNILNNGNIIHLIVFIISIVHKNYLCKILQINSPESRAVALVFSPESR